MKPAVPLVSKPAGDASVNASLAETNSAFCGKEN